MFPGVANPAGSHPLPPPPFSRGPLAGRQLPWSCTHCWQSNDAHIVSCTQCGLHKCRMVPGFDGPAQMPRQLAPMDTSPFNRPQHLPTHASLAAAGRSPVSRSPSFGDSPSPQGPMPRTSNGPSEWCCQGCGNWNSEYKNVCNWCMGDRQVCSAEFGNERAKPGDRVPAPASPVPPRIPQSPPQQGFGRSQSPVRMLRFRGLPDMPVGFCASLYKEGRCNVPGCTFRHDAIATDPHPFVQQLQATVDSVQFQGGRLQQGPAQRQSQRCSAVLSARFCGHCGHDNMPPQHVPATVSSSPFPAAAPQAGDTVKQLSAQGSKAAATNSVPNSPLVNPIRLGEGKQAHPCDHCRSIVRDGQKFCHNCGRFPRGDKSSCSPGVCVTCTTRRCNEALLSEQFHQQFVSVMEQRDCHLPRSAELPKHVVTLEQFQQYYDQLCLAEEKLGIWQGAVDRSMMQLRVLQVGAYRAIEELSDARAKLAGSQAVASAQEEVSESQGIRNALDCLLSFDIEDSVEAEAVVVVRKMLLKRNEALNGADDDDVSSMPCESKAVPPPTVNSVSQSSQPQTLPSAAASTEAVSTESQIAEMCRTQFAALRSVPAKFQDRAKRARMDHDVEIIESDVNATPDDESLLDAARVHEQAGQSSHFLPFLPHQPTPPHEATGINHRPGLIRETTTIELAVYDALISKLPKPRRPGARLLCGSCQFSKLHRLILRHEEAAADAVQRQLHFAVSS